MGTDAVAAALARRHTGAAVRLARQRRGWSQTELGIKAGFTQQGISDLENRQTIDTNTLHHLLNILGVSSCPTSTITELEEVDDMRRRDVLTTAGLVLAGIPLGIEDSPHRITDSVVAKLRTLVHQYRQAIYRTGSASRSVERGLARLLEYVVSIAPHSVGRQRRELLETMADIAGLAGHLHRDLCNHNQAQQHYVLAIQASQAAGNNSLSGYLVVRMAGHHIELKNPSYVLNYLNAVSRVSSFTPAELSNQQAIKAWGLAQQADIQAVHRAVAVSEDHFSRQGNSSSVSDRPWQRHHTNIAELYSLTGCAYTQLSLHDSRFAKEAARRLELALNLRPHEGGRQSILDQISLTEAYISMREFDQAATLATSAFDNSVEMRSRRVATRLRDLTMTLREHSTHRAIRSMLRTVN